MKFGEVRNYDITLLTFHHRQSESETMSEGAAEVWAAHQAKVGWFECKRRFSLWGRQW